LDEFIKSSIPVISADGGNGVSAKSLLPLLQLCLI